MANKFQCHYRLQVSWTAENGQPMLAEVSDPVTIKFSVSKVQFQSDNSAQIIVTNMDGGTREALYQDRLIFGTNRQIKKMLVLDAGYGGTLVTICKGWISECYSVRKGTDVETIIEVIDPDILSEYCSITFDAGTSFEEAYKYLTAQMPSLQVGEMGELRGEFKTPVTFNGNTFVAINKLTGQHTFIENGVIHTLQDNETLSDYGCYLIQSETGLLETPRRREAILEIVMLFEPTLRIGQMVEIKGDTKNDSSVMFKFQGQYKILEIHHDCTISGAEEGQRITTLHLQYLDFTTSSNVNLTDNPEGSPPSVVKNNQIKPITTKISSAVQAIYRQIMRFNGSVPNNPITNLITWRDMIYSGKNTPTSVKNSITLDKLGRCEAIATLLTDFVNTHFSGKKISIHSGYRTPANNANTENSAKQSNHMKGSAIDFHIPGVPIKTLHSVFKANWRYGLGTYSWGLHVSTNPRERFRGKG